MDYYGGRKVKSSMREERRAEGAWMVSGCSRQRRAARCPSQTVSCGYCNFRLRLGWWAGCRIDAVLYMHAEKNIDTPHRSLNRSNT